MGDQSQADDLLHRCLYAFEMAWHHSFSIAPANCTLDPERSENKGFLEALFRQLQVLTRTYMILATPPSGGVHFSSELSAVHTGCRCCTSHDGRVV